MAVTSRDLHSVTTIRHPVAPAPIRSKRSIRQFVLALCALLVLLLLYPVLLGVLASAQAAPPAILAALVHLFEVVLIIGLGIIIAVAAAVTVVFIRIRRNALLLRRIRRELQPEIDNKVEGSFWKDMDDNFTAIIKGKD